MIPLALSVALLGCDGPVEEIPLPAVFGATCPDGLGDVDIAEPARTVVLITVDTLRADHVGDRQAWATTPFLDGFFAGGVVLPNGVVTRGLSAPSLASVSTGLYPRTHTVRNNEGGDVPDATLLQERFQAAGYQTGLFLGNICELADRGVDERLCLSAQVVGERDQLEADQELLDGALAWLDTLEADTPAFVWVHLMDPHSPYTAREPWFSEMHPEPYTGTLDVGSEEALNEVASGETPVDDADLAYARAVYASQVRAMDAALETFAGGLDARGRLEDAVVAFGADHGDELAERDTRYFFHGCSIYNSVLNTSWAIRAPGRVAAGERLEGWFSSTDIAPTLVELAGLAWDGDVEGTSLVDRIHACLEPNHTVFFERSPQTAGAIWGGVKYVLDPSGGFAACEPYTADAPYPNAVESLYDLAKDPGEVENLATSREGLREDMRRRVCAWVRETNWSAGEGENALEQACGE